ncbi:MAG TPA: MFS transporter, partial [Caulobacteraceae bacterium]
MNDATTNPDTAIIAAGEAMGATEYIETPQRELRAAAAGADGRAAEPFSSLVPAIIGGALMMQTLSATVIANALPTMARSFHEDPIRLNTTITMYLLASAVFLPISGWMADRFGAKRIFLIAIVAYAASCAACGLANNLPEMLFARACEGAAGAMMGPVGRLVLLRSTPKHNLVRAMSVLTMPALLGPVIGPPIGGFIITYGSWRWIFFLNLPIAVLGVVLVWKFIDDVREQNTAPLDWIGLILTGAGMAAVVW